MGTEISSTNNATPTKEGGRNDLDENCHDMNQQQQQSTNLQHPLGVVSLLAAPLRISSQPMEAEGHDLIEASGDEREANFEHGAVEDSEQDYDNNCKTKMSKQESNQKKKERDKLRMQRLRKEEIQKKKEDQENFERLLGVLARKKELLTKIVDTSNVLNKEGDILKLEVEWKSKKIIQMKEEDRNYKEKFKCLYKEHKNCGSK